MKKNCASGWVFTKITPRCDVNKAKHRLSHLDLLYSEGEGTTILRKAGSYKRIDKALHPRKLCNKISQNIINLGLHMLFNYIPYI